MAKEVNGRAPFLDAWLEDAKEDFKRYGPRALVPTNLLWAVAIGLLVAFIAPDQAYYRRADLAVPFMVGMVTIDGFFLGLSWNSFAKIYEIASRAKFAAFLRRQNMLGSYFFHVDFIHYTQIVALTASFLTLVFSILDHPPLALSKILLAASISSSIYALKSALGAVKIMQDLVWYSAIFDEVGDTLGNQVSSAIPMKQPD